MNHLLRFSGVLIFLFLLTGTHTVVLAQACPNIIDGNGVPSASPQWFSCNGNPLQINIQPVANIPGPITINWGDGNSQVVAGGILSTGFVSHTYAAVPKDTLFTISITGSCTINGQVLMKKPALAGVNLVSGEVNSVCAPDSIRFINTSTDADNTTIFYVDFGDNTYDTLDHTSVNKVFSHYYLPGTVSCNTAVSIRAVKDGCIASTNTFSPILIWDKDSAVVTANNNLLCYPDTLVTFTNSTVRNCDAPLEGNTSQRYEKWILIAAKSDGTDSVIDWRPSPQPAIQMRFPGIGVYCVQLLDSSFCGIDTSAITCVEIVAPPTASFTANKDTICEGETVTFTNLSTTGTGYMYTYNWGDGTGNTNTTSTANQNHIFNTNISTTTTRMVVLTVQVPGSNAACSDRDTLYIVVEPEPRPDFRMNGQTTVTACDSVLITFTDASLDTAIGATWQWDLDNDNVYEFTGKIPPPQMYYADTTINGPTNITIRQRILRPNGCQAIRTRNITINRSPVANFTANSVCLGQVATFQSTSVFYPAGVGGKTYQWDFDGNGTNDASGPNPTHTYTSNGTYNVRLIVSSSQSCPDTIIRSFTIEGPPTANFTPSVIRACSPMSVTFDNTSVDAVEYFWKLNLANAADTSSAFEPTHVYTYTGTDSLVVNVRLIARTAFGCTDSVTRTLVVYPNPTANFTVNTFPSCIPQPYSFTASMESSGETSYEWDFDDGTVINTLPNPFHQFVNNTASIAVHQVKLRVYNDFGCVDSIVKPVLVYPQLQAVISITGSDTACAPFPVQFNAIPGVVSYDWDFDDGTNSSGPSPLHVFNNTSTINNAEYNVRLIYTTALGCIDTAYRTIVVFPQTQAAFVANTLSGCHPLTVSFDRSSTVAASQFSWDFGDGSAVLDTNAAQIQHQFSNTTNAPIQRTIVLNVENAEGCTDTFALTITIYPDLLADFDIDTIACSPFIDTAINLSEGATRYRWYVDGVLRDSLFNQHFFIVNTTNTAQQHTITLQARNAFGCTESVTKTIHVLPLPVVQFTTDVTEGCAPLTVTITNQTTTATDFEWDFGDGQSSTSNAITIDHQFTNTTNAPIIRTIRLRAMNSDSCVSELTQNITVYPDLFADFDIDTIMCTPFIDTAINLSAGAARYRWYVNGVLRDSLHNQHFFIANTTNVVQQHTITLQAINAFGCSESISKTIHVLPVPLAQFATDVTEGCAPFTLNLTNQTTGAISYEWDFGDGQTSTSNALTLSHLYTNTTNAPLTRTIRLRAFTADNCVSEVTQNITAYPDLFADFTIDTLVCTPFIDTAINLSTGAVRYRWYVNGVLLDSLHNQHFLIANNTNVTQQHTITLQAINAFGCTESITKTIRVLPVPVVQFAINVTEGCTPYDVTIINQTTGAASYEWDFGDGQSSTTDDLNFTHRFVNTGIVPITRVIRLRAFTVDNCVSEVTQNFTVFPDVQSAFEITPQACSPYVATAENQSEGATRFYWYLDGALVDSTRNRNFTIVNNTATIQTHTVRLQAISPFGCVSDSSFTVSVFPKPVANFIVDQNAGCQPFDITITNLSTPGLRYYWDFGNGIDSMNTPTFTRNYENLNLFPVDYTIQLIVINSQGCSDTATRVITVYPYLEAAFITDTIGCSPFIITPRNNSINAVSHTWFVDNAAVAIVAEPQITLTNTGNTPIDYSVRLDIQSSFGCIGSFSRVVRVYPTPVAQFLVLDPNIKFPQNTFSILNQNIVPGYDYHWDFGDGETSTNPNPGTHSYTNPGTYSITLTVSNEYCSHSLSQTVFIEPPTPVVNFNGSGAGCLPFTVSFRNNTLYADRYLWDFGDGEISEFTEPAHTYTRSGTFTVTLTGFGAGGQATAVHIDSVIVFDIPNAYFVSQPRIVYLPSDPLVVFNLSTNATDFFWDFGDGITSTEVSPEHYYSEPGDYTIRLISENQFGCRDTFSVVNAVRAEGNGAVVVPNAFTPDPFGASGGLIRPGEYDNNVFHPVINGAEHYYFSIYNRWGELLFESRDINIGWDGYYRGELCKQDVYVWKVEAIFSDGKKITKAGDVLLLR